MLLEMRPRVTLVLLSILLISMFACDALSRNRVTFSQHTLLTKFSLMAKEEIEQTLKGIKNGGNGSFRVAGLNRKQMANYVIYEFLRYEGKRFSNTMNPLKSLFTESKEKAIQGSIILDTSDVEPRLGGDIKIIATYPDFWKNSKHLITTIAVDFDAPPKQEWKPIFPPEDLEKLKNNYGPNYDPNLSLPCYIYI